MVKTRMGLLDLRVQTAKINASLQGSKVTNVYDAHNGRTYILKLSVPPKRNYHTDSNTPSSSSTSLSTSASTGAPNPTLHSAWEKRLLLIESGVRIHMTHYDREKDVPSGFCIKLRKHIRTRRLEAVRQLGDGGDRIVDLVFSGEGAVCAHLIIEAFSGGNVILTDANYTILTLLRTYRLTDMDKEATRVAVRERYPTENARPFARLGRAAFLAAAFKARAAVPDAETLAKAKGRAARRKLYAKGIAKKALAMELALEPTLLEHALLTAGFSADAELEDLCRDDGAPLHGVFDALTAIETQLAEEMARGEMNGYVISSLTDGPDGPVERYDEFSPFLFAQYRDRKWRKFESFDEAADEFFARVEAERVGITHAKREAAAYQKVDKLESELKGQVSAFENARDRSLEMAQAIESNVVEVEAAITVIRSAIAAAVPWDGLAKMVKDEKRNGNPVAEIIHSLQLERNQMTLMLEDTFGFDDDVDDDDDGGEGIEDEEGEDDDGDDGDDDDDVDNEVNVRDATGSDGMKKKSGKRGKKLFQSSPESRNALLVPVEIDLTAHANARRHYEMRKSAAVKMEKAEEVKDRTIKAASKKAASEAQKLEEKAAIASIRARRKAFWFEKFYWFISSENFLVVAGRDAQQNDLLVKRYLGPADAYVHADLEGASSVIVKNRKMAGSGVHCDIPRMTLEQAGTFAMCRSAAWESKIVTSAWWVRATQVSKTTSTGQYLPVGSFAIRGKKNFMNPTQLVMGLAFLFKVDECSAEKHKGERSVRGLESGRGQDVAALAAEIPEVVQSVPDSGDGRADNGDIETPPIADLSMSRTDSFPEVADQLGTEGGASSDVVTNMDEMNITASDRSAVSMERMVDESAIQQSNIVNGPDNGEQRQTGKKRISAKERRAMKNARGGDVGPGPDNNQEDTASASVDTEKDSKDKGSGKGKGAGALPRRKKHKLKKMKKYMDQDEEERKIALAVLGSKPIKEHEDASVAGAADVGRDEGGETLGETADGDGDGDGDATRKKRPHEPRQEDLRLLDDEGIIELARLEEETTSALDVLTAIPNPDDEVQFALPVCGPYHALARYRYRVKLMPGNMKRGTSYRSAIVMFQKMAEKDLDNFKQEREAIRLTPERDGIHGMMGNVKIMSPGLADAQKTLMKAKKNSGGASSSKKGKKK